MSPAIRRKARSNDAAATGEELRAHIFVAALGASNYTYAEARWTESLPDWIGAHANAFAALGGVPTPSSAINSEPA